MEVNTRLIFLFVLATFILLLLYDRKHIISGHEGKKK